MFRSAFLLTLVALINLPLLAQVAVGQWRDHLSYGKGVKVADAGEWVYAASESGLMKYHKTEGDLVRMSKVTGLSDIGYSSIAWSDEYQTLVVTYTNTNIDVIQNGRVTNIPDIKNKSIVGNKIINDIHIKDGLAYLACGFAIVVLDIVKLEIKDTYYIGPNGANINVLDIATSNSKLYACTEAGVYHASLSGFNLASFENWSRFDDIPISTYNAGTWFNNRLYVNLSVENNVDSIYFLKNGVWEYFDLLAENEIRSLESTDELLVVTATGSIAEYDASHNRLRLAFDYGNGAYAYPFDATVDKQGVMWIADGFRGLVRHTPDLNFSLLHVNGPSSSKSTAISIWDGRCYVASGGLSITWKKNFTASGMYTFKDNQWDNISVTAFEETSGMSDFVQVLVDPFDSKRVYVTAWGYGLLEYYDDQLVEVYDTSNSTLNDFPLPVAPGNIQVFGMAIDRNNGSLWVAGSSPTPSLYAKEQNGTWHSFNLPVVNAVSMGNVVIDNIGQKWIQAPRGVGLVVFNDNGTFENTSDDQSIKLTQAINNGNLASNDIFSLAVDLDGEIWVGTEAGISVFYSPENVFTGDDFDSQQILIEQDGNAQFLLENERITVIAIDGANRKWLGTSSGGVFLMSEDGTEQILHFTEANSPLFSDEITAIGIDHLSGEVFIGTSKGIISYKGTATWGTQEFTPDDVYAYPNPVKPNYNGLIAIKGLVRDADVKITDAAGKVIFATIAEGGQAIWNGNSFSGSRAKSGVYLVFASNNDGKETFVTKILFIN